MKKVLLTVCGLMFGIILVACNGDKVEDVVSFYAELRTHATEEEITYVINVISEHPLINNYEFRCRYEERDRIIEGLAGDNDEIRETLENTENLLSDVIIIEVAVHSLDEVLEFVSSLESVYHVQEPSKHN